MASISGLERLEKCLTSEALPHIDEGDNVYSAHGRAVHAYLDDIASGTPPKQALARVSAIHMDACAAINLEDVPHSQVGAWKSEIAFALDWEAGTARVLQLDGHRAYPPMGPTEIPGTADLVGLDPDPDTLTVLDVKTGRRRLGEPADSLQLLGYALAACFAFGRARARVGYLFAQKDEDVKLVVSPVLTEMEMMLALRRIKAIMERVEFQRALGTSDPKPGDHCRYCPAYRGCPAHTSMLAPLLTNHMDIARASLLGKPGQLLVIRPEDIPQALQKVEAIIGLAKRLEKELEDAVRAIGSITLPDGRILGEVENTREKLDPELARPVLLDFFGEAVTNECIETKPKLTKAAITRAVNERVASTKEKKSHLTEAVLEEIRKRGGVSVSRYYTVELKAPGKLPAK